MNLTKRTSFKQHLLLSSLLSIIGENTPTSTSGGMNRLLKAR